MKFGLYFYTFLDSISFFNFIPQNLISFSFYSNFGHHYFQFYFFGFRSSFVDFFFQFYPHYLVDWESSFIIFLGLTFMVQFDVITHVKGYKDYIGLDSIFYQVFLLIIFFSISSFNFILIRDLYWLGICFFFFTFLFMDLSQSHVPDHGFSGFTRADSSIFYVVSFISLIVFLVSHLQHLIRLRIKLHDFIRFAFHEVILVSRLNHIFGLLTEIGSNYFLFSLYI
jgi:hypothetical protein